MLPFSFVCEKLFHRYLAENVFFLVFFSGAVYLIQFSFSEIRANFFDNFCDEFISRDKER